jgi:hypothetical protein
VIVHGYRQNSFCAVLTDHVVIQNIADFLRRWHSITGFNQTTFVLFSDDIHAELYAFITNEYGWSCYQLTHFVLAFSAKRAIERVF